MQDPLLILPPWLKKIQTSPRRFDDMVDAMIFVIAAAKRNSYRQAGSGGPFAAAVIDNDFNLVALGVNLVVPSQSSILHAEMVALLLAQRVLGSHDLRAGGDYTLVTSCAPCAMCLGAIPFSGVHRVVCGARGDDAESIGFDEGDKPESWADCLRRRGIAVEEDVCRTEAAAVLTAYSEQSGVIY